MSESGKSINNIRINDLIWFTLQDELISFRYKGLPEDVHFTISFNNKSEYLNLHLTKNIKGIPVEEKPKIYIFYVKKSVLKEVSDKIMLGLLSKFLSQLNTEELKNKFTNETKFIPYELLNDSTLTDNAAAQITDSFKDISKVEKGTRLKIDGDLEAKFLEIAASETIQNLTNDFAVTLTEEVFTKSNSGIVFLKEETFGIIKIEGQWFRLDFNISLLELLKSVILEPWATQIQNYIHSSIEHISTATKKADVAPFNKPIPLVKVTNQKRPARIESDMLKRDKRWEIFYGDISLEDFVNQKLPKFHFKNEVNQEIKDSFDIVFRILKHAYFEYPFLDVAVTKALHILEMAFKIRYRELNQGENWNDRKPLKALMDWFQNRHYFESNNPSFLNHVREIRNHLSHPTRNNLAGTVGLPWVTTVMDLINGLYENIDLRIKRWESTKELKSKFDNFLVNGARLKLIETTYYIYGCGPVAVDNRLEPTLCYFTLLPLFDVTSTIPKIPYLFSYPVNWLSFQKTSIELSMGIGKITLSNDLSAIEIDEISAFKAKLDEDKNFRVHHSMLLFDSENTIRNSIRESDSSRN